MENEKIFKALSEDASGVYFDEDDEIVKKDNDEENINTEKLHEAIEDQKLDNIFTDKIDPASIAGYHLSKINGVDKIGLFYRKNSNSLLIELKCKDMKRSLGFTLGRSGELNAMERRSNHILKDVIKITKEEVLQETKNIIDSLIPDSVIENERQYLYWETDEDLLLHDKKEEKQENFNAGENGKELDDKRLEVIESINEIIPDPIGKIMTISRTQTYDMALVFKNLIILESRIIGEATYMIPVNIEMKDKTKEEIYEQVINYFGFTKKELKEKFGAVSQKHPDHKLSSEEFKENMIKLVSVKFKEEISSKIREIIEREKNEN